MMFRLITYICFYCVNLRLTDGKRSIPSLPRESLVPWGQCFNPSAAVAFHLLNNVGNGLRFGKHQQRVYMVLCPVHA